MEKKNITTYIIIASVSFLAGLFFNQFFLYKYFNFEKEQTKQEDASDMNISSLETEADRKISTVDTCSIYVDVSGAVVEPGVYCFDSYSLVIDAVKKAGGFKKGVAMNYISRKLNLSLRLKENEKLYFPFEKEVNCELQSFSPLIEETTDVQESSTSANTLEEEENTTSSEQCVNINTATKEELKTLNGVGDVTAEKIMQARPFQKIEDLLNVSGIGESTFNKFKEGVCI
ncbi:hypothetical protein GYA44_02415 [Candidatus Microgenomates bacterium]|nr:hypothetical protein [Candidatus Microgenomates bacterium]